MCKIVPFAATLSVSVSILTLIAISFDRFFIIVYPHKKRLKLRECFLLLFTIWIIAFIMSGVKLYNYAVTYHGNNTTSSAEDIEDSGPVIRQCEPSSWQLHVYETYFLAVFHFILPLVLIMFVYFRIGYYIFVQRTSTIAKKHIKSKRRVSTISQFIL
jgi:hypothetical protein